MSDTIALHYQAIYDKAKELATKEIEKYDFTHEHNPQYTKERLIIDCMDRHIKYMLAMYSTMYYKDVFG